MGAGAGSCRNPGLVHPECGDPANRTPHLAQVRHRDVDPFRVIGVFQGPEPRPLVKAPSLCEMVIPQDIQNNGCNTYLIRDLQTTPPDNAASRP